VSTSQLRTIWWVARQASPFLSFLTLLSVRIIRSFDWSEDFVQGVEEHPTKALASLARAL
jgi:hypothetical protein